MRKNIKKRRRRLISFDLSTRLITGADIKKCLGPALILLSQNRKKNLCNTTCIYTIVCAVY